MKIVIDRNIPFIREPLERIGEVTALPGDAITPEVMAETDILFTRTRTRCDENLLRNSRCRFIGTATIGTDHIDLGYCKNHGITAVNAPGCNAPAVAQYVLSAISTSLRPGESLRDKTLGIIGVGNVGSILARWAKGLGMHVLLNDPPLAEKSHPEKSRLFSPITHLAEECDAISIHTPLTKDGPYPTHHLLDAEFYRSLKRTPLIINAARGGVIDTEATKTALTKGLIFDVAIDCWEGEPDIDLSLLSQATVATPHIAGYSKEGKIRATAMVLDALRLWMEKNGENPAQLVEGIRQAGLEIPTVAETITPDMLDYDIMADTSMLKNLMDNPASIPGKFEELRNTYHLRPEPGHNAD